MKTAEAHIVENTSGILVNGIRELDALLRFFYGECTAADKFPTDLFSCLKEQLTEKDYADICFRNSGKGNFRNSWVEVYRTNKEKDLYLLTIHTFYTNPFVDKNIEQYFHNEKGAEYGVLSIDVNMEIAAEGKDFYVDCNQIISCVKNALGDELEVSITGKEMADKFVASEKYNISHVVLLENADFEIWCSIEEVPGPYTFDWSRLLWKAEESMLSGPRKFPCEGFFKDFLKETRGDKEYNPVVSIVILGSTLLDTHRRSPMLEPKKTEALKLASKIEAAFLML